ncbi:zinc finger CCCH domain-containing protein 20-like [Rutidosis leptorrhynchoides]|uniref:zinc finger CCCH domain-containing protein 20-like n=1 Tax=Rutidosis leptorrhynchoides TaxID=125765 RepID=UPI003A9920D2
MMMLIGRETLHSNPTVQVPPWATEPTDYHHTNLPSPYDDLELLPYDDVLDNDDINISLDAYSNDHFRMYDFKVKRCARGRSHDWTECPYAHPGEKARRRDPRKFHYSGNPCPDFRKGTCHRGDTCEYAHGVFECWLHPSRYRTQPCKDGVNCRRRICFFAHTPDQLRVLPPSQSGPSHLDSYDGSPSRLSLDSLVGKFSFATSPTSTMYPPSCSPPMSPIGQNSVNELTSSVRNMQIGNGVRLNGSGFGSPRNMSTLRPCFASLPSTPTRKPTRSCVNPFDLWETMNEEEPVMERVESGKDIRAKLYAKLSRENSLAGRDDSDY